MLQAIKTFLSMFGFGESRADHDQEPEIQEIPTTNPAPIVLTPAQERMRMFIAHARLVSAATAETKVVRFVDDTGAVLWLSGLSPQDAHGKVAVLQSLGFDVLGIVDISALDRKPTWQLEYEDPQCYMEHVVDREDPANFNLGTVELRLELIEAGMPAEAVIRATSASFTSPTFHIH